MIRCALGGPGIGNRPPVHRQDLALQVGQALHLIALADDERIARPQVGLGEQHPLGPFSGDAEGIDHHLDPLRHQGRDQPRHVHVGDVDPGALDAAGHLLDHVHGEPFGAGWGTKDEGGDAEVGPDLDRLVWRMIAGLRRDS